MHSARAAKYAMQGRLAGTLAYRATKNVTSLADAPAMAKRVEFALLAALMTLPLLLWMAHYSL